MDYTQILLKLLLGMILVSVAISEIGHKFYRSKVTPLRIQKMEEEAKQDPTMYCSEWFVAVCAVAYEKAIENVTGTGKARDWPMEHTCREFNKVRGEFWGCYNKASEKCGRDIFDPDFRYFEEQDVYHPLPDMRVILDGTLDKGQTQLLVCREFVDI